MLHHEEKSGQAEGEPRRRRGAGRVLFAGLVGSLVGAAAAMLLSPWRGAEARLRLKQRSKELAEGAKKKFRETVGRSEE